MSEEPKKPKKIVAVVDNNEASIKITIQEDKKHFKQSNESY
jgi:hypothetical protein